jgi:hypothetical protein
VLAYDAKQQLQFDIVFFTLMAIANLVLFMYSLLAMFNLFKVVAKTSAEFSGAARKRMATSRFRRAAVSGAAYLERLIDRKKNVRDNHADQ